MKYTILLIQLILVFSAFSQTDFEVVQLPLPPDAEYSYSQCEPSIAIHPTNPKIIAAGSILSDYYYSLDGGKTWTAKTLKSKFGVYGDPVLMFDTTGMLHYFHLSNYKKGTWLDRIVCQSTTSVDGEFNEGTHPQPNNSKVQDKHWTIIDPSTNVIYMTWTEFDSYNSSKKEDSSRIVFSKSLNQGQTWSKPVTISTFLGDCMDGDETVEGATPAVGPNGELYVVWSGPKGIVFQKSLDGGETWLENEQMIMDHVGGWDIEIPGISRSNGMPVLTCDLSESEGNGTLYVNWVDTKNGEKNTDVWLMKSTDGGDTWSDRIRVNQDKTESHQFLTWMSIDQSNGNLYFIYYDRRNHKKNETDVYMSVSRDGGKTFKDYRISESPFLPTKSVFFGDYLNIASVNGVIRPIYPRMDKGKISLWVTLIHDKELKNNGRN